ncbi:MAG TPA: hypothetical protein DCR87_01100 [Acidobacteria bacterium]|nr:hypothetical protein [Acidobacteriota bacterium]
MSASKARISFAGCGPVFFAVIILTLLINFFLSITRLRLSARPEKSAGCQVLSSGYNSFLNK